MSYARERWRVWKKNGSDLKLSGLILRSSKVEFWKRKAWGDRWICFKTARVKRWQSQKIVLKDVYENIRISFLHVKTQTTHKTREKNNYVRDDWPSVNFSTIVRMDGFFFYLNQKHTEEKR